MITKYLSNSHGPGMFNQQLFPAARSRPANLLFEPFAREDSSAIVENLRRAALGIMGSC